MVQQTDLPGSVRDGIKLIRCDICELGWIACIGSYGITKMFLLLVFTKRIKKLQVSAWLTYWYLFKYNVRSIPVAYKYTATA
jgi:hypothetical protein